MESEREDLKNKSVYTTSATAWYHVLPQVTASGFMVFARNTLSPYPC